MSDREVIRKLTDLEWAMLEPRIRRSVQLQAALDRQQDALAELVQMAAGGESAGVSLDVGTRELFRVAAPKEDG